MNAAIPALNALAQETRLSAFRLLVKAGARGLNVGVIAARLGANPSTLSRHLAQLEATGLVSARRDGRHTIYRADFDGIGGLIRFLLEDCCDGAVAGAATAARADVRPGWWPGGGFRI